jgi:ribosomal protein S12 methylthiotransferase accessory factor
MHDPHTTRLSSSLRARTAEQSLPIAAALAMSRGVSRVVDTTWLDRIGIPVYASIRPDALKGSICVNAGKGFTHAEAKIGAYMEAIEFSFAPHGRNGVEYRLVSPHELLSSFRGEIRFPDFAPVLGRLIQASDRLAVVTGQEICAGLGDVLVPGELVYSPFFDNPGVRLYGTSTNGLASGNTLQEATVHALAEVMERHVRSFDVLDDRSCLVDIADATPKIRDMAARIDRAGLRCYLRYSENGFGLPYFSAYVLEPDEHAALAVASGFGFHPNSDIAAVRAIAEAAQGRLTFIHGGRDDIIKRFSLGETLGREQELHYLRQLRELATSDVSRVRFTEIPNANVATITAAEESLFEALRREGLRHVVRIRLTEPDYPFQVVRVVVPGAEAYEHELKRVGPRLLRYFQPQRSAQ